MLIDINGISVDFPHTPYAPQVEYMSKVLQALEGNHHGVLESPTGTGKTLSLLCSVLAWREHKKEENLQAGKNDRISTVIYASRTHTQLSQVVNELKNTSYSPKVTILSSRQNLCVHPEVSTRPKKEIRYACRILTKGNNCQYKVNADRYGADTGLNMKGENVIMDIEELRIVSEQRHICPYYLSRNPELQQSVELVFMPYNYLVDESVRNGLNVVWNNSIVIIDEAHNLESVCDEASSFSLSNADIAMAVDEIDGAIARSLDGMSECLKQYVTIKKVLLDLELHLESRELRKTDYGVGLALPGGDLITMLADVGLPENEIMNFRSHLKSAIDTISKASALEKFDKCLERVFPMHIMAQKSREKVGKARMRADDYFCLYISDTSNSFQSQTPSSRLNEARMLNFWCFSPGVALSSLMELGVSTVLLTSGTLSPLDSFASQMALEFPARLENPHVVRGDQVWVGVVKKGPTGKVLNSSYRNRDTNEYKSELGHTICNFARIVPHGMLVFFPSYGVMDRCLAHWKAIGVYARIEGYKKQIVEARNTTEMSARVDDYNEIIEKGRGAVFYAICRGKASEGIDFSNHKARAVIITGLPYPPSRDARVVLKRRFLDKMAKYLDAGLRGDQWYQQQASRAVNQAVGRVIRHKHDYGAIILCDERFGSQKNSLSKWLRSRWHITNNFGESNKELVQFFRNCLKDSTLNKSGPKKAIKDISRTKSGPKDLSGLLSKNFNFAGRNTKPKKSLDSGMRSLYANASPVAVKAESSSSTTASLLIKERKVSNDGKKGRKTTAEIVKERKRAKKLHNATLAKRSTTTNKESTANKENKMKKSTAFLENVKTSLSKEEYRSFKLILKKLKSGSSHSELVEACFNKIGTIFSGKRESLRKEFYHFLPPTIRKQYAEKFSLSALLVNLAKAIGPLLFHSTRVLGGEEKRKVISKFLQIKHIIKATQERVKGKNGKQLNGQNKTSLLQFITSFIKVHSSK